LLEQRVQQTQRLYDETIMLVQGQGTGAIAIGVSNWPLPEQQNDAPGHWRSGFYLLPVKSDEAKQLKTATIQGAMYYYPITKPSKPTLRVVFGAMHCSKPRKTNRISLDEASMFILKRHLQALEDEDFL
jgi:hypothetical protein